jgi:RNase P subunit RPR2
MEYTVKVETCPECKSTKMKNYVAFKKHKRITVYVECAECGEFVARYRLHRYLDINEPYESFLHQISMFKHDSGRKTLNSFKDFIADAKEEFKQVKEDWQTKPEMRKIYQILEETGDDLYSDDDEL